MFLAERKSSLLPSRITRSTFPSPAPIALRRDAISFVLTLESSKFSRILISSAAAFEDNADVRARRRIFFGSFMLKSRGCGPKASPPPTQ